eukprot:30087-Pelagococcus_subviridis.AAC.20
MFSPGTSMSSTSCASCAPDAFMIASTHARLSLCIASSSAVLPPALTTFGFAPFSRSLTTTSSCPFTHAQCNAVFPCAFVIVGSALLASRMSTISRCPFALAKNSAVLPSTSCASGSMP